MAELTSFIDIEIRSKKAKKGSREVVKSLNEIDKANDRVQKETKETGEAFKRTGDKATTAGKKSATAFKKVSKGAKKAKKDVKGLAGGTKALSASMTKLAKTGVAALAAGLIAVGLSLAGAIGGFAEFSQSIADLSAITGATGKDLEFFSKAAREMGAITTLSAAEVADAFRLVASAKPDLLENAEALKEVTRQAISLAEAAGISVPEAANTMASALNQFGAEADQAAKFTDILAAGSKFGAASIAEMGEALREGGVAAASMGLDFAETNAALQLLSTSAIKGGSAGTQLKGVLLGLELKTKEFKPSVLGMSEALRQFGASGADAAEQFRVFGRLNLVAGQILTGNADKFDDLTEKVQTSGIAAEQAGIRTDTLSGATARLKSAFAELGLVLTADSGVGVGLKIFVDGLANATLAVAAFLQVFETSEGRAARFTEENNAIVASLSAMSDEDLASGIMHMKTIVEETTVALKAANDENSLRALLTGEHKKAVDEATAANIAAKRALENLITAEGRQVLVEIKVLSVRKKLSKEMLDAIKANELLLKARAKADKKVQDVVDSLQEELDALKRTDEEQELYNALKQAGVVANSEASAEIEILVEKLREERAAIKAVADEQKASEKAAEDLATASEKAAKDTATAWQKSRDSLSDFFTLLIHDGANAFDTIVEGFKNMITKMIAEAAANKILLSIGLGGSGSLVSAGVSAATSGGGAGGVASGGSILSSASSFVTGGISGVGNAFIQAGTNLAGLFPAGSGIQAGITGYVNSVVTTGNSILTTLGGSGASAGTNAVVGGLANFGAGVVGNLVGTALFGDSKHGGTLSTIGGVIGSIWGPIGAAIGSFLGSGLGKLVGGTNRAAKEGNIIDLATGDVEAFNREHTKEFRDGVNELTDILIGFSDTIGGSQAKLKVTIHGEDGLKLDIGDGDVKFGTSAELLKAGLNAIIAEADELSDALKRLAKDFKGSLDQTLRFTGALISIEKLAGANVVQETGDLITESAEQDAIAGFRILQRQSVRIKKMIENFDGSAGAAERLNAALVQNKASLVEMVVAIRAISVELDATFSKSIDRFRDAGKTPDQLQFDRLAEVKELEAAIPGIKDPGELFEAAKRLDFLLNEIFSNITPEQQAASGDLLADKAEEILASVQDRLEKTEERLSVREEEINEKLNTMLFDTAEMNQQAADTQVTASENNLEASENNLEASENNLEANQGSGGGGGGGGGNRNPDTRAEVV